MNRVNMWSFHVFLGLLVLGGINSPSWNTEAYNIESWHYTSYSGEPSSMFGFSVAEYRDRNRQGWVIVGAPQAHTRVPTVYRGGAVFKCNVGRNEDCHQIQFDNQAHNRIKNINPPYSMIQIDNKTLQWFGATVVTSAQDGGPILACAPRYVFFGVATGKNVMSYRKNELAFGNQRDPVGTCFMRTQTSEIKEFAPCRTKRYGFHQQGSCQAGFGAAVSKDGARIFVGAPGSNYWQGQMYSIPSVGRDYPYAPPGFRPYGVFSGQTFSQKSDDLSGKVMFTEEGSAERDDGYLGYSVVSGTFFDDGQAGTAVGVPRGDDLFGMVVLYPWDLSKNQTIPGAQMGSYFGYALAAGDIDNDGLDDLIVGAPMYTVIDNPQNHFETGKVYIFYGKGPEKYITADERSGEDNRGRFGMSLAYLGDIDRDGYGDFAVGAPYAGPEGRGAVYIYQGSSEGLLEKYSQVIYGQELKPPVTTFGFSISGGLDLDGNLYPDMVVGAYESESVMFFRSRPVIEMVPLHTYVQFGSSDKLVSLEDRQCLLSDRTRVSCLELKTCFMYTGHGVLSSYEFNVQYALDTKNTKEPRMYFLDHEKQNTLNATVPVRKEEPYCHVTNVYIEPSIRDKLTSLDAEMRMSLKDNLGIGERPRDPSLQLRPILARTSLRKDSVSIRKNCGSDNICTPDLQLNCTSGIDEYLLGSDSQIVLHVTVVNAFEDAFEAMFNLKIPLGIEYKKIVRIDKNEIPVQCSTVKNSTLKCDIGNPLPKDSIVKFNVILEASKVHQEMSSYNFEAETNSSNPEDITTTHDNTKKISIKIWVKTDLVIDGESKPKDVHYYTDNYTSTNVATEDEYGPGFTHNYTIHNGGPFTIEEAEVFLVWPAATLAGDDLVYLLEQPETSGPIVCASANANPLSLKLDRKSRTWVKFSSEAAKINGGSSGTIITESGTHVGETHGHGSGHYPPIPPYNDSEVNVNGEASASTSIHGTSGGSGTVTSSNSTHKVIYDSNGQLIVVENDWTETSGVRTTVNINKTVTETTERRRLDEELRKQDRHDYQETKRQHKQENERRRQEEEDNARRQEEAIERRRQQTEADERRRQQMEAAERRRQEEQRTRVSYGTEKYGGSGDGLTHGVIGGGSVLSTGIRTDEVISGDREESFGFRLSNVSSSQDLATFLNTLTKDSVAYDVFTEGGKQYLRFLGRFRLSDDKREYIEFKDGTTFPLENRYGAASVAAGGDRAYADRQFKNLDGQIITAGDGRGYIQLRDGRRFALKGSFTYTEEHTYTRGGDGRQHTSVTSSGFENTDDDYDKYDDYDNGDERSWTEESTDRGSDANREFETHSTRTHEEKRTFERKQGSRFYNRNEGARLGDDPSTYRQDSGLHKRGSRYRREDDAMSVEEFKKFEKKHRLHKREDDQMYDDIGNRDVLSYLNDGRNDEKSVVPMCKAAKCVTLKCTLGRLEKDQEVWISAVYRVKGTTLKKIAAQEELKVSTQLISQVTKLPTVGKPEKDVVKSHEISTSLQPKAPAPGPEPVPLWIVVLSACAGVIILLLLIYLLHKCGFFKRNRPTDAPEREPLNRNGHFHGDEHL